MADIIARANDNQDIPVRWHDNADGTWSIQTSSTVVTNTSMNATTATLANVAASASSVTLLALNALRLGAVIVNDSTSILYVKFGSTASATSYTYLLGGSISAIPSILELPANPRWTGIITGIWASATGSARVTELTA